MRRGGEGVKGGMGGWGTGWEERREREHAGAMQTLKVVGG